MALRGALAVLFGIAAIIWPAKTLAVLVITFGAYALIDGCYLCFSALRARDEERSWALYLVAGLVGALVGILMLGLPGVSIVVFLMAVAAWAIVKGVFELVAAVKLREVLRGEWLYVIAGALSVAFGLLVFFSPGLGAAVLLTYLALYALLFGVLLIGLAFRLRRAQTISAAWMTE
jgi:uncharacterized membrane protein HdeD (DUF308 family)